MAKKVKIKNFQEFKNLKKRQVFSDWDKEKGRYKLNSDIPTKELIKGLRHVHKDFEKYDLRKFKDNPRTRGKVTKIINEWYQFKNRPDVREFIPQKSNRKKVSRLSGQSTKWKKFYIPDGKITYKSTNDIDFAIETTDIAQYAILYFVDFEEYKGEFAFDPEKVIKKMRDFVIKNIGKVKYWRFITGNGQVNKGNYDHIDDIESLMEELTIFTMKYNGEEGKSNYNDFLVGIKFVIKFNPKNKRSKKKRKSKK